MLLNIYRILFEANGWQNWWPGNTDFEICIGAILTQNTAWSNVRQAIKNLKAAKKLNLKSILSSSKEELAELIRPAGYFNQKAGYLIEFCRFLKKHSIKDLKNMEMSSARDLLLSVKGVGKETADSIMLYALDFPIFVIDAYTKRIFSRVGVISDDIGYDELQLFFHKNLKTDLDLFNDYHAQIVFLGKNYCSSKPKCSSCPLNLKGVCKFKELIPEQ